MFELFLLHFTFNSTKHTLMIIAIYCMTSTIVMANIIMLSIKTIVDIGVLVYINGEESSIFSLTGRENEEYKIMYVHNYTYARTHAHTHTHTHKNK